MTPPLTPTEIGCTVALGGILTVSLFGALAEVYHSHLQDKLAAIHRASFPAGRVTISASHVEAGSSRTPGSLSTSHG